MLEIKVNSQPYVEEVKKNLFELVCKILKTDAEQVERYFTVKNHALGVLTPITIDTKISLLVCQGGEHDYSVYDELYAKYFKDGNVPTGLSVYTFNRYFKEISVQHHEYLSAKSYLLGKAIVESDCIVDGMKKGFADWSDEDILESAIKATGIRGNVVDAYESCLEEVDVGRTADQVTCVQPDKDLTIRNEIIQRLNLSEQEIRNYEMGVSVAYASEYGATPAKAIEVAGESYITNKHCKFKPIANESDAYILKCISKYASIYGYAKATYNSGSKEKLKDKVLGVQKSLLDFKIKELTYIRNGLDVGITQNETKKLLRK